MRKEAAGTEPAHKPIRAALWSSLALAVAVGGMLAFRPGDAPVAGNTPPGAPSDLTVGDRVRPLAVEGVPQFGWLPQDSDGGEVQTAYQVRVIRHSDGTEVWDSGRVESSEQSYVSYAGPTLPSGTSFNWTVRTWDRAHQASPWAELASFDTGIPDSEWAATWIRRDTGAPDAPDSVIDYTLARKQFTLSAAPVVRVRAYAAAMGDYELYLNGQKAGRSENYDYPGEAQYEVFDITPQAQAAQHATGAAANQLAVGMRVYYHVCRCQGRANGPVSNSSTLALAARSGDSVIHPESIEGLVAGDVINIGAADNRETFIITGVGGAGTGGTGVTLAAPLGSDHPAGTPTVSSNGPSGLIVRIVAEHSDGTRDVFVSDGSWKVTKDTAYTNASPTWRAADAGDYVERYDARKEVTDWDTVGYDDSDWPAGMVIGPHPRPAAPTQERFTHLVAHVSGIHRETIRPVSVTTLADGAVVADFGRVVTAVPQVHFSQGRAGRSLSFQTAYTLTDAALMSGTWVGDVSISVGVALPGSNLTGFEVGDTVVVDGAGPGRPTGDPETRTIAAFAATGADTAEITLDAPLDRAHDATSYVSGSRASTSAVNNQGSDLTWYYIQKDGEQTAEAFVYWGWRYLQLDAPGAGESLTADDIAAVLQHTDALPERAAAFDSGNDLLDEVFSMLQRSGLYASQETLVDTPTREKGQFTGDAVDISLATMAASGERTATQRVIRQFIASADHVWMSASGAYCPQAPCSYSEYGPSSDGRLNAVYPNGDGMRDIPDYTALFPGLVWAYYLNTGDRSMLDFAYPYLRRNAAYLHNSEPPNGPAAGLTWLLPGGAGSYQNGIIDWPSRFGYAFDDNGARTVHAQESVAAYRATARVAVALDDDAGAATYNGYADALTKRINEAQRVRGDVLYSDGLRTSATTTAAVVAAGSTTVRVASVTPFAVGDLAAIDYGNGGASKEIVTVTAVGTPGPTGTGIEVTPALASDHDSGVAVGIATGEQLFPAATTLATDAEAGSTTLKVVEVAGFAATTDSEDDAGRAVVVGTGPDREVRRISAIGTAGETGTGITLDEPLTRTHPGGAFVASPSQQAQAFAIHSGVAPEQDWPVIAEYISAQGLRSAPMTYGVMLEALGMADRPDAIADMLTRTDSFGPAQIVAQGGTFAWEDWVLRAGISASHGWGARAVTPMLTYVLGIEVTSPGASTISIRPPGKGLDQAKGSLWTQRGRVDVAWNRSEGEHVELHVSVPVNVTATISLPGGGSGAYSASGEGAAKLVGVRDGRAVFTVGSGNTWFEWADSSAGR